MAFRMSVPIAHKMQASAVEPIDLALFRFFIRVITGPSPDVSKPWPGGETYRSNVLFECGKQLATRLPLPPASLGMLAQMAHNIG